MNCVNISAYSPVALSPASLRLSNLSSVNAVASFPRLSVKVLACRSRYRQCGPVCLFGGKKSGDGDQASPKEAVENFLGSFKKEQSIEDVLRQQIQKQEFFDDGGSGKGGLGSGGSGGGGSGDSNAFEDESNSAKLEELMQVLLASLGFIFLYMYILDGEDITRYTLDVIKVMFGGKMSIRLERLLFKLRYDFKKFMTKEAPGPMWLERSILSTTTWFDYPYKYRKILGLKEERKKRPEEREVYAGDIDEYYYD